MASGRLSEQNWLKLLDFKLKSLKSIFENIKYFFDFKYFSYNLLLFYNIMLLAF